jgi:molecular chaperone DnaK (HSP70)
MPQIEVTFDIDANGILRSRQGQGDRQGAVDRDRGLERPERRRDREDEGRRRGPRADDLKKKELVDAKNRPSMLPPDREELKEHGDKTFAARSRVRFPN